MKTPTELLGTGTLGSNRIWEGVFHHESGHIW